MLAIGLPRANWSGDGTGNWRKSKRLSSVGVRGHWGAELRRFILLQQHEGEVTVERLTAQLRAVGISISKGQVMRLLIDGQEDFLAENGDVLREGLSTAAWITVEDKGERHDRQNGFCTQIGNDGFTGSIRGTARAD